MVTVAGLPIGWALVVLGTLLLVLEAFNPGFFVAVPGTVLIILGILILLGVDIFSSPLGIVLGVVIALIAAAVTVWMYSRIAPDQKPMTTSRDSLEGKEGRVVVEVTDDSLQGKVLVEGQEWSAQSIMGKKIPAGSRIRVIRSEGVHVDVEEI
jgi:membrane-bound ClpP family serine protease